MAALGVCMAMNMTSFTRASAAAAAVLIERKAGGSGDHDQKIRRLPENVRNSRVLIVGGTGVAGRSTAIALSRFCPDIHIVIGARNRDKGARFVATLGDNSEFAQLDIEDDVKSLAAAMTDVDLVVHAAGPFEYLDCNVLEAAIESKTAYIDVCDNEGYARRAKSYKNKAIAAGIPAITNGGVNPGVSNLMAATLVQNALSESSGRPESLRFHYFTAGSGGTGPGVLATSFFLMADKAVTYHKGVEKKFSPYSGMLRTDFGESIGKKEVFLMNVPEVASANQVLGVPNISARFGTAPFFWNWTLSAMIKLLPTEFLKDKNMVKLMVQLSYPMIQAVDLISGQAASIKVDLQCSDGYSTSAIFSHKRLSEAAGTATAAFVIAVLEGSTKPGVWYPEEPEGIAVEARETLLRRASQGATEFLISKSYLQKKETEEIEAWNVWDMLMRRVL